MRHIADMHARRLFGRAPDRRNAAQDRTAEHGFRAANPAPNGTFVPRVGRHGSKATLRWRRGQSPSPAIHIFRPPNQISRPPPHRLITCPKFHDDNEREYAGNFDNLSTDGTLWTDGFHGSHHSCGRGPHHQLIRAASRRIPSLFYWWMPLGDPLSCRRARHRKRCTSILRGHLNFDVRQS